MDKLQKIGKLEAFGIILMVMANQIILNLPNALIISIGSSTWINIIYISILAILFCLLICKLFKPFLSSDIIDISEYIGGKTLKIIVGILYILFFLFFTGIFVRYLANSLKIIYFQDAPLTFILLFFIIATVICSRLGIKSISRVNLILIVISIFSMIIILITTVKYLVPQRIFPFFGFGLEKIFVSGTLNVSTFVGFAYLYFMIPILKEPEKFKKIALTSIIFSAIYLLISILCLIMMFPFVHFTDEMLSIYLLARLIKFGRFLQRIDAIFILIWILSMLSFLSISSFLICYISKKLTNIKDFTVLSYPIASIIFSIALIIKDIAVIKYLENVILKYFTLILVFFISLIILILAYYKKKRKNIDEV